jgi:hypothetical protein
MEMDPGGTMAMALWHYGTMTRGLLGTAVSIGRFPPLVKVESDTTVQYQSYHIFLGFQFLVYEKVEHIFLIISDYHKQKADTCRRNVSQNRLGVSYHRLVGRPPPTNRMPSCDGSRLPANQSARRGSRVLAVSTKKYSFACFFIVATSLSITP